MFPNSRRFFFPPATARAAILAAIVLCALFVTAPLLSDSLYDDEVGHRLLAEVLRAGEFGLTEVESAAFIVNRGDGSLGCELWPTSQSRFEENFRGSLPPNTVAIVHTHPVRWPKPSIHDADEAARLAVPIYVVTRNAVFKVAPGREPEALVKGRRWFGATREPAASCERIERFSEGEAPIAR